MPEYLAPGVYVEETSFRAKSIEGVGTSTTAFAGPCRKGPLAETPQLVTSYAEFARLYGSYEDLALQSGSRETNYFAHAVRAFFNNGGSRLYVSRAFTAGVNDGVAKTTLFSANAKEMVLQARYPGSGLNGVLKLLSKAKPISGATSLGKLVNGSLIKSKPLDNTAPVYFCKNGANWDNSDNEVIDTALDFELLTLAVTITASSGEIVFDEEELGFADYHPRALKYLLPASTDSITVKIQKPYKITRSDDITAAELHIELFGSALAVTKNIADGNDGALPTSAEYSKALNLLNQIQDVAIVAAPGHSADVVNYEAVQLALISHASNSKSRISVLDTPKNSGLTDVRDLRGKIDSTYAAMYYPWVVVANPLAKPGDESIGRELILPPSGFICGIYARNDIDRGVWKAPANEVVNGALRFEQEINEAQQAVLNPEGINCLRSFFGRGNRVWGARTISSDPEWKYVNIRRYFIYLEQSIERSTQWAVFEPNGERLWSNISDTVSAFLYNEWRSGALMGTKPEEAFFVRCDRSTMTQNDLDNGRLICEIGVAAIKPAEFVVFRIGQWTADSQS